MTTYTHPRFRGHGVIEDTRRYPCTAAPDPRCECGRSAYECELNPWFDGPDPDEYDERGLTWVAAYQEMGAR